MSKDEKEIFDGIRNALYHIHSIADIIDSLAPEYDAKITSTKNETSDPLMSLAQIIKEKAELCLAKIDEYEAGEVPA